MLLVKPSAWGGAIAKMTSRARLEHQAPAAPVEIPPLYDQQSYVPQQSYAPQPYGQQPPMQQGDGQFNGQYANEQQSNMQQQQQPSAPQSNEQQYQPQQYQPQQYQPQQQQQQSQQQAREQYEAGNYQQPQGEKKTFLTHIMHNFDRVHPGLGEIVEKEKPLIAELMVRLKNREVEKENTYQYEDTSVSDSSVLYADSFSSDELQAELANPAEIMQPEIKSKEKPRKKSQLENWLSVQDYRDSFRAFLESKGAEKNLDFWEACDRCQRKNRGCATLAKRIVGQVLKEMKDSQAQDMDALNSAVLAVRSELKLSKGELRDTVKLIVNKYVRDTAPNRVNLIPETRRALIRAADSPKDALEDREVLAALDTAQREIIDLMNQVYFIEFST